jgi:4a-hydroxytetrahydrobiopterin dehydratase
MEELASRECPPCEGWVPAIPPEKQQEYLQMLDSGWTIIQDHHLAKDYHFSDFANALAFTNRVGTLAERVGHHPDIYLAWGKVRLKIWTHKINGLTESDFVLAAKADSLL